MTARISLYRNGPYIVRGDFEIADQDGNTIEVRRQTIALCRCGRSRTRPFCDGTHKATGFRADAYAEGTPTTVASELLVDDDLSSASEWADRASLDSP